MGGGYAVSRIRRLMRGLLLSGFFAPMLLFLSAIDALASFVVINEDVLPKKTVDKIEQMGAELKDKCGVWVYLAAKKSLDNGDILAFEERLSKNLNTPFILLSISVNDKKIDIIASDEVKGKFDKEQILSPLPWRGSILPLITAKSKDPHANIEAGLLNGYAEIVEQVAASCGVELDSAIGNQNRVVFDILKLFFYGIIAIVLVRMIYGRLKKNRT